MKPLDPVELAFELMSIDSTSGHEGAVVAYACALLSGRGWRVRPIPVSEGRENLLASATTEPLVTFTTHLDTVPPFFPPRLEGERVVGRGACDAKGIAAAMICAAEKLRARGVPVALLLLVGEETLHDGARAANRIATTSRVLIGGEPTGSTLAVGCKGSLRATIHTRGRAAHSAYPHLGHSAIDALLVVLHDLRALELPRDPLLGDTTLNIGWIEGGVADNVVAPSAQARLMVRLVTAPDEMRALLERSVAGRAEIAWGVCTPPLRMETVDDFPTATMAYTTDLTELSNWGKPYLFGPGSIHVAHGNDEHILASELHRAVDSYERLGNEMFRQSMKEGRACAEDR
ncbi:MAG TPA: M20/M25/M40 family metallo-hydrolase [Anaeromyxobacteraceae bacterium]|nr:M20/M25/M40 family metallo-hydrolase [Anaeromyxobacteraceae bacterium]